MYITMSDIRREILEEITRVRLDKTRLYTLLLKMVDSCECCNKTSASAPAPVAAPVKKEPVKEEPAPVEVKPKAKATTKKASATTKKTTTKKAAASTSS
jgi:hypothetical protein